MQTVNIGDMVVLERNKVSMLVLVYSIVAITDILTDKTEWTIKGVCWGGHECIATFSSDDYTFVKVLE